MNCEKVRVLIDSVSFTEDASLKLAVERHTRHCDGCRAILEDAERLDAELGRLPEPEPPADLLANILRRTKQRRTEQLEERAALPEAASSSSATEPAVPKLRARRRNGFGTWAATVIGLGLSLGALIYRLFVGEATARLITWPPRDQVYGFVEMPQPSLAVLALTLGLLLYLHGLFSRTAEQGDI